MMEYIEANDIIIKNHHGSRKMHSTNTALANISHHLYTQYYTNQHTALIQTDLAAEFDAVD